MRTVQVQYKQNNNLFLDDINVPSEVDGKWNACDSFIANTLLRKYGAVEGFVILKWYN